jgi:hypothetical protein
VKAWSMASSGGEASTCCSANSADAPGVHDSRLPNEPIERHVCMPADHNRRPDALKDRVQERLRRQSGEAPNLAAWRSVAKQQPPKTRDFDMQRPRPTPQFRVV